MNNVLAVNLIVGVCGCRGQTVVAIIIIIVIIIVVVVVIRIIPRC
jgi:hypothetical protein